MFGMLICEAIWVSTGLVPILFCPRWKTRCRVSFPLRPRNYTKNTDNYLNHSFIVENLASHIDRAQKLSYLGLPYTFGETSSMAIQGREELSDTFGMALWLVDYSLWAGAHVCPSL